jgi:hypothetical protein
LPLESISFSTAILTPPLDDRHEIIGSGDDGADGDGDDVDQQADDPPPEWVGEIGGMILEAR